MVNHRSTCCRAALPRAQSIPWTWRSRGLSPTRPRRGGSTSSCNSRRNLRLVGWNGAYCQASRGTAADGRGVDSDDIAMLLGIHVRTVFEWKNAVQSALTTWRAHAFFARRRGRCRLPTAASLPLLTAAARARIISSHGRRPHRGLPPRALRPDEGIEQRPDVVGLPRNAKRAADLAGQIELLGPSASRRGDERQRPEDLLAVCNAIGPREKRERAHQLFANAVGRLPSL
jgi:hypothetical protein